MKANVLPRFFRRLPGTSHLLPFMALAALASCEKAGRSAALLSVQRQDAIRYVLQTRVLRDPDSASFSFEQRGSDTLRVRVRHQNQFGAFLVQRFDVTFPPDSVVASDVREVQ